RGCWGANASPAGRRAGLARHIAANDGTGKRRPPVSGCPSHTSPRGGVMRFCPILTRHLVLAALLVAAAPVLAQEHRPDVDVALALGVDISYSMNADEQRLQRLGYVEALTSKLVLDGIKAGPNGRIAVTYYEWASDFDRRTIVPWTIID